MVTTKKSLTFQFVPAPPSPYEWLFGPQYRLEGMAVVNKKLKDYDTGWISKLDTNILATGREDSRSVSVVGFAFTYKATAKSSIETNPIGVGFSVGDVDLGFVIGVKSKMEVEATVEPLDPSPTINTSALAFVHDPFYITNFPSDDALALSSTLRAGDILKLQWESGTLLRSLVASTDIPGMETLYRLDMTMTPTGLFTGTSADVDLDVSFMSHPSLGISDADVIAAVLNALVYNDTGGYYEFISDVTLFDGFVEIPDHIHDFKLAIDEAGLVSTSSVSSIPCSPVPTPVVPEPSSLLLMAVATSAMLMPVSGKRARQWFRHLRQSTCPLRSPTSTPG